MDLTPLDSLLKLDNRTAIVTGAVGIGYGIAYRLAEAGANVAVASLHKAEADGTAADLKKHGWKATAIEADVSIEEDVRRLIEETRSTYGAIDILVNNAGIYPTIPVMQMSTADFERVLAVNLRSVFLCSKYAVEQMIRQGRGGKIINITSIDALHPSSVGLAHYDASKHGVWGFTKNLALELAPRKIWVNAIAPGGILTPGVRRMQQSVSQPKGIDPGELLERFMSRIPMHRFGEPDEIGKVALFLASEMSSYMTGSQIVVDGGVLLS
jgi:2-deoxy-D-gluconate 3-dehydrogenase